MGFETRFAGCACQAGLYALQVCDSSNRNAGRRTGSHFSWHCLCAGVGLVVLGQEVLAVDAGIDLRGGQAGVAEQLLYGAQVCPATQQVGPARWTRLYDSANPRSAWSRLPKCGGGRAGSHNRASAIKSLSACCTAGRGSGSCGRPSCRARRRRAAVRPGRSAWPGSC